MSVLDVGCFDGFYAFLAERRGGPRRSWRWTTSSIGCGSRPGGASSWRAGRASEPFIDLLGSGVEYRRRDAFALDRLEERFDYFVCCFATTRRAPRTSARKRQRPSNAPTSSPTGECQPASVWVKTDRVHPLIPRTTERSRKLYCSRGAVEREFGRLKA
jgi:hypothetical protein